MVRPVFAAATMQVGLPRQECRNLQHVGDFGDRRGLVGLVDVGQDRHAEPLLDAGEHLQPLFDARVRETTSSDVRFALS